MPHVTFSAGQAQTTATPTADNATPNKYRYVVLLSSEDPVCLDLVPGTTVLENDHFVPGGVATPDSFSYDPGVPLGHDKLDSNCVPIPGTTSTRPSA